MWFIKFSSRKRFATHLTFNTRHVFFEKPSRGNPAQDRKFFARGLAALTRCLARPAQDVLLNATSIARLTIDVVFNTQGILLKTSQ